MSTYSAFVASRLSEVDYRDPRTETFLKEATVRQLRELSRLPVDFLDGSYSFNTIADQDNYGVGHTGFPTDVYSWVGEPYVVTASTPVGTKHFIRGPVPIQLIRGTGLVSNLTSLHPDQFAWHNGYMWLAPKPSGIVTISGDYRRDGTKDSASGATITTASTTHTNGWFSEGENVLRCAVLLEWFMSIAKDPQAVQLYSSQLAEYKDNLKKAGQAKRLGVLQMGDSMFGSDTPAYWSPGHLFGL